MYVLLLPTVHGEVVTFRQDRERPMRLFRRCGQEDEKESFRPRGGVTALIFREKRTFGRNTAQASVAYRSFPRGIESPSERKQTAGKKRDGRRTRAEAARVSRGGAALSPRDYLPLLLLTRGARAVSCLVNPSIVLREGLHARRKPPDYASGSSDRHCARRRAD